METTEITKNFIPENNQKEVFEILERGIYSALETYSNVHRGSGLNSMVSTHLYEQARDIVLDYLDLSKSKYVIIFCIERASESLQKKLTHGTYQVISSQNIGLSLGVRAIAVKKNRLPGGIPVLTGGGTTKLISQDWVIWANAPDRYEAGTPAIINVIALAKALQIMQKFGDDIFRDSNKEILTPDEILYQDELKDYTGKELLDKLRETLIDRGLNTPTVNGQRHYTNLDNSASTPTFKPIWDTFRRTLQQTQPVQQEIIRIVRKITSEFLGAPLKSYDVIFTSNTTEAINLAAENLGLETESDLDSVVLNSFLEHSSNDLPWRMIPNISLIRLSIDDNGFFDLNELDALLCAYNKKNDCGNKRIKLVAISGASNVLGVCNNLEEISTIVHRYGAKLLVDAAQLVAHRKVDMETTGIDYLAFSAHKIYAPFGCGALVARKGLLKFSAIEMKQIQTSGEENAAGIAALGKTFSLLQRIGMDLIMEEEKSMTRKALKGMSNIPGLTMFGITNPDSSEFKRKLGVIVFGMKAMMPDKVAKQLAVQGGIGVRYGCHCAHILVKRILHVGPRLERFQRVLQNLFPKIKFPGVVRVSFGIENTMDDVDTLIHVLNKIAGKASDADKSPSVNIKNETVIVSKAEVQKQLKNIIKDSSEMIYSS